MNEAKIQILRVGRNTGFTKLSGKEVQVLMRKSGKTIRGLAGEMQITMKRVREVREKGLDGYFSVCEWVQAITGNPCYSRAVAARLAAEAEHRGAQ